MGLAPDHGLFFPYQSDSPYSDARAPLEERFPMTITQALRHIGLFAAAALLVTAISFKSVAVHAMGTDTPYPTTDDDAKKKKKKSNMIEQQEQQLAQEKFLRDYRAARQTILAGNYQAGIAAMHALGHDEHPDVANYIVTANGKRGNNEQSKIGTGPPLKANPTTPAPGPIMACGRWNRAT